jgi:hypothetical protein
MDIYGNRIPISTSNINVEIHINWNHIKISHSTKFIPFNNYENQILGKGETRTIWIELLIFGSVTLFQLHKVYFIKLKMNEIG